ncbi:uncharacterized protein LY89DRAFT_94291 [Mollisia scopiformis]|uniref:Uncharacterized protein n=1 Tax=Mollisia scopiformis TaxID=149040 RepID=A0A194X7F8_MOLSC|nr:uncharacterized protein LY89DRAFT_94291 [Mollisia scopiformis]KUJ15742.1 hypothetical protein LY89DRAFT_94291 [Mollisia scopiformis]
MFHLRRRGRSTYVEDKFQKRGGSSWKVSIHSGSAYVLYSSNVRLEDHLVLNSRTLEGKALLGKTSYRELIIRLAIRQGPRHILSSTFSE